MKAKYIRGKTRPGVSSTGVGYLGVTTFAHIRKPRTQKGTLCGAEIYDDLEVLPKRPKHEKNICHICERIYRGEDPVFDDGGQSFREFKGTRGQVHPDVAAGKVK